MGLTAKLREERDQLQADLRTEKQYAQIHRLVVIDLANGVAPAVDISAVEVRFRLFRPNDYPNFGIVLISTDNYHEVTTIDRFKREWVDSKEIREVYQRLREASGNPEEE
jgi:hypothetical protein